MVNEPIFTGLPEQKTLKKLHLAINCNDILITKYHLSIEQRMSEINQAPKVGLYEKFRSFTVKHLSPINTLFLLGATAVAGFKAIVHLGWIPEQAKVEQQQPQIVQQQEPIQRNDGTAANPQTGLPSRTTGVSDQSMSSRHVPKQQIAEQPGNDTLQILSKQLDDERLKHANAILDANLK